MASADRGQRRSGQCRSEQCRSEQCRSGQCRSGSRSPPSGHIDHGDGDESRDDGDDSGGGASQAAYRKRLAGRRRVLAADLFQRRFQMRHRPVRIAELVETEQADPE